LLGLSPVIGYAIWEKGANELRSDSVSRFLTARAPLVGSVVWFREGATIPDAEFLFIVCADIRVAQSACASRVVGVEKFDEVGFWCVLKPTAPPSCFCGEDFTFNTSGVDFDDPVGGGGGGRTKPNCCR